MNIPKKLKIGGHIYKVIFKKLEEKLGETNHAKCEIVIDNTSGKSQQEATLIHEIFHTINGTMSESTLSHCLLDSLSEQFYQVLKDNKLIN